VAADFVQRGRAAFGRRQYADAAKILRLGLLSQPTEIEGRLLLGQALTALHRWDEALGEMRIALEARPDAGLAWLLKGEALLGLGDYTQAERALERARALDPESPRVQQLLDEVALAREAGIDPIPAGRSDTRVYPVTHKEPSPGPLAGAARPTASMFDEDDATEVESSPAERIRELHESATALDPDEEDTKRRHKQNPDDAGPETPHLSAPEPLPPLEHLPTARPRLDPMPSPMLTPPRPAPLPRAARRPWLRVAVAAVVVVAVVAAALLARDARRRKRVAQRREQALALLAPGNYDGFRAAERLYGELLGERRDPLVVALRARVRGQLAFEFGAPPEADDGDDEARVYGELARGADARKDAARLRERRADARASYLVGRAELSAGQPEAAAAALRVAVERDARDPLVLHGLGLAEAAAGHDDRALDVWRRALELNPQHVPSLLDRALFLLGRGDAAAARVALEAVTGRLAAQASPAEQARAQLGLQRVAADGAARRAQALHALEAGDVERARDLLDALGSDGETLLAAARAHLECGDPTGAAERLRRATQVGAPPGAAELQVRVYLAQHRPADALDLAGAIPPDARTPALLALTVEAHLELGQLERADEALRRAPARARQSVEGQLAEARIHLERGHDAAAAALADLALRRLHGADGARALRAEALTLLGRAQWEQGSFRPALAALEEATRLAPHAAPGFYNLALVDQELRRDEAAGRALEAALVADPKLAEAHYALGRLRARAGDARAAESLRTYLALAPTGAFADEARALLARPTSSPARTPRRERAR
jgi:tetratricopeptide (TPR) repeat protein